MTSDNFSLVGLGGNCRQLVLGGEWDAHLLLLDAAVFLGVVGALITVNTASMGQILALGQRLIMTNFLGYHVANSFGNFLIKAKGLHLRPRLIFLLTRQGRTSL